MSVVLTDMGVKVDKNMQDAILALPTPQSKEDVRRMLAVVPYLSRFSEGLSTKSSSLRTLVKKYTQSKEYTL